MPFLIDVVKSFYFLMRVEENHDHKKAFRSSVTRISIYIVATSMCVCIALSSFYFNWLTGEGKFTNSIHLKLLFVAALILEY
jgi:hypothetical protein